MSDTIPQDAPKKQCTRCKEWFDASPAHFFRATKAKDGLQTQCKTCIGKPRKPVPEGHKRCRKCDHDWPATAEYFYSDSREPDGFRLPCKQCIKSYEQTDTRKEQKKPYKHQYYMQHQDEIKQRSHDHAQSHKEEGRAYSRRYYALHYKRPRRAALPREARLERDRQLYRENYRKNPGYYIALVNKRKARKRTVPGTHTAQQIREQYRRQKGQCYYCQQKVEWKKHHVDHTFPLSRVAGTGIPANSIDYLVITCQTCNLKKHDKFPWEWPEGGRLL